MNGCAPIIAIVRAAPICRGQRQSRGQEVLGSIQQGRGERAAQQH